MLVANFVSGTTTAQTQLVTYLKRGPNLTRAEFWDYWQSQHAPKVAPLAAHLGITRYQQVLPTLVGQDAPSSSVPVDFDGIAMLLYPSVEVIHAFVTHPYYVNVVEPDEHVFMDKSAFGAGMVATFRGTHTEVVDENESVWTGDPATRQTYQELFEKYL
ncbi:ethyl tert-butyl ether degradation [Colletotrichum tofieldiae]|nr:ethyl tert-butyl ether degradation [Colletotrichum tofieldiae]GKT80836.1 ethyl tert-butyl ether degradation [Colletotrichum tofieldiae]GKT88969.1 ethyl tert-butyl ether degradation [Colletotrichum tofieldiae]